MRSRVVVGVGGGAPSDCSIIPELCPLYILFYTQEVPVPSSSLSSWSVDQISLKYGKVLLKQGNMRKVILSLSPITSH